MNSRQIEDRAAEWLVKRDRAVAAGEWTPSDQRLLEQWQAASTANLVAFLRLEAAWVRAKRLKALGAGVPAGQVPAPDAWPSIPPEDEHAWRGAAPETEHASHRRRKASGARWALAAGMMVAAVAAGMWLLLPDAQVYRTPLGGLASIPMADGSRMVLNSESEARVEMTPDERRIVLLRGEAYFEVKHEPSRPFAVVTGTQRVVAVGTAFSVRREAEGVRVVVTEGKVKVEPAGGAGRQAVELVAGNLVDIRPGHGVLQKRVLPHPADEVSWHTGYLMFRETRLSDALAAFNRYNVRKIAMDDEALADIRLSGKFQPAQYEAFVRLLERDFGVRARYAEDGIRLAAR